MDDKPSWPAERKFVLGQIDQHAKKHDDLCDEVVKLRIAQAVTWTKVALIAAIVAFIAGFLGSLFLGLLKLAPAILKFLQSTK